MILDKITIKPQKAFKQGLQRISIYRGEMTWVVLGRSLSFIGVFLNMKLLTSLLGPAEYGKLAIGMTITGIISMFAYGVFNNVLFRFYSIHVTQGTIYSFFHNLKKIHSYLSLFFVFAAIVVFVVTAQLHGGQKWAWLIALAILYSISEGINGSFQAINNARRKRKVVALCGAFDKWLRPAIAAALIMGFGAKGTFAMAGYLACSIILLLVQGQILVGDGEIRSKLLVKETDTNKSNSYLRDYLRYATPFLVWAGFGMLSSFGDRWVLQGAFGEKEVGIYVALYQLANAPMALLFAMLSEFINPIVYQRISTDMSNETVRKCTSILTKSILGIIAIILPVASIGLLFGDTVVRTLTSTQFVGHTSVLAFLGIALLLFNVGQVYTTIGCALNRPAVYMWPKAIYSILFILLALVFIKTFALAGMAIALCISSLLYAINVIFINHRLSK
jgi:O-antigen/teichoic acid export membrane protein